MNFMAMALVALISAHHPTAAGISQPAPAAHGAPTPAPRLTAKQKAWFKHAIDHILTGD